MRWMGLRAAIAGMLMTVALIAAFGPPVVLAFTHRDPETYLWVISGPWPFDHFGGGPAQLGFLVGGAVVALFTALLAVVLYCSARPPRGVMSVVPPPGDDGPPAPTPAPPR